MPKFDPHVIIQRLAEADRPHVSLPDFAGDPPDSIGTQSMEVPFTALRIPSREGRGWIPEPDVEKACWKVFKSLPNRIKQEIASVPFRYNVNVKYPSPDTWEETVLRAAEAWMKEKP